MGRNPRNPSGTFSTEIKLQEDIDLIRSDVQQGRSHVLRGFPLRSAPETAPISGLLSLIRLCLQGTIFQSLATGMPHADRRMVEESHDMWIDVGFEAKSAVLGTFSSWM